MTEENVSPASRFSDYMALASDKGLVDESDSAVIFYDIALLDKQVRRVRHAFGEYAVHAVAIKANPLVAILSEAARLGLYAEAASFEEMGIAHVAGMQQRLVWDSPAKSQTEIAAASRFEPYIVNLDSLDELAHYSSSDQLRLGLRVNPAIEPDAISALSVGHSRSKFGTPIANREAIIEAFCTHEQLTGLHVHSSSNTRSLEPLIEGIGKILELAEEIDSAREKRGCHSRIKVIDIGGGLPLSNPENMDLSVEAYAQRLKQACPQLFSGRYEIVTEFGRYYHAAASWTASRIEYIHQRDNRNEIITHVGADHFVREVYDSAHWQLQFDLIPINRERGPEQQYNIAGPLCFEGDRLGNDIRLPEARTGDYLVISNSGANTYALWSRHCSRAFPKVILYRSDQDGADMHIGKQRERIEDVIRFWS